MKKIKFNLLAILGIIIAIATVAFKDSQNVNHINMAETYWFLVDDDLMPTEFIASEPTECEILLAANCAREYEAENVELIAGQLKVKDDKEDDFIGHRSLSSP